MIEWWIRQDVGNHLEEVERQILEIEDEMQRLESNKEQLLLLKEQELLQHNQYLRSKYEIIKDIFTTPTGELSIPGKEWKENKEPVEKLKHVGIDANKGDIWGLFNEISG